LGDNFKMYCEKSEWLIEQALIEGRLKCEACLNPMTRHSKYPRTIKETGQSITLTVVWCRKCRDWHSLQPDFLLPCKHYSGNEIEGVIIDSATEPTNMISTAASESTVRRWIRHVSEGITQAVGILKSRFGRDGRAVSEVAIDAGQPYDELEQLLEMAPAKLKCSGNKLGLANMWLGASSAPAYI